MIPYDNFNVFAKIIRKEMPARVVYEDDDHLCFHSIVPLAELHVLLITKAPFVSYRDFIEQSSSEVIASFFRVAHEVACILHIEDSYKLITNHGSAMGQEVFHFHLHIMSLGTAVDRINEVG